MPESGNERLADEESRLADREESEQDPLLTKEMELGKTVIGDLLRLGVVSIEDNLPDVIVVNNLDFFRGKFGAIDPDTSESLTAFELMSRVPETMRSGLGGRDTQENYYHVFRNKKVTTREDLEKGFEPREMFFTLDDPADLTNVDKLRGYKGKFYLLLPELGELFEVRNVQPTRKEGFSSGIDPFVANTLAMIYILGDGRRDEDGNLWVNRISSNGEERQRLSGSWIARMGFESYFRDKWRDRPIKMVEKYGKDVPSSMLNKKDFIERSTGKMEVGKNGQLMVEGTRIYFGRDKAGYRVTRLSGPDNTFALSLVDADGQMVVDGVFKSGKLGDAIMHPLVIEGKIVGMRGGSYRERKLPERRTIRRYDAEGKVRAWKVDLKVAVAALSALKDRLTQIDPLASARLEALPFERQLHLLHGYMELGGEKKSLFEKNIAGRSSTYLEATAYLAQHSGIKGEGLIAGEMGEDVLRGYCDTVKLLRNFRSVLEDKIETGEGAKGLPLREFVSRISESVAFRMGAVLGEVTNENVSVVGKEMRRLNSLLMVVEASLAGFDHLRAFRKTVEQRYQNGKVSHVSVVQGMGPEKEADQLIITFRPERNYSPVKGGGGQPRIGFTYKGKGGRFNLRIDLDSNGLSVDVGSHGGDLAQELSRVGLAHYTYGIVDPAYQLSFADYVRKLAAIWGVSESTWQ